MKEEYKAYLTLLYQKIPDYAYEGGIALLMIGTVLILSFGGLRKGWRYVSGLLLVEYIALIYCSTVIFRGTNGSPYVKHASIENYKKIVAGGNIYIHPEMLMNVLVFVPLGVLCCMVFKWLKWWHVLMIGCGISVSIEVLQYVLRRGTTEVVDVFHNTLGCLIGIGVYELVSVMVRKVQIQ